jgi:hypothetical protein
MLAVLLTTTICPQEPGKLKDPRRIGRAKPLIVAFAKNWTRMQRVWLTHAGCGSLFVEPTTQVALLRW